MIISVILSMGGCLEIIAGVDRPGTIDTPEPTVTATVTPTATPTNTPSPMPTVVPGGQQYDFDPSGNLTDVIQGSDRPKIFPSNMTPGSYEVDWPGKDDHGNDSGSPFILVGAYGFVGNQNPVEYDGLEIIIEPKPATDMNNIGDISLRAVYNGNTYLFTGNSSPELETDVDGDQIYLRVNLSDNPWEADEISSLKVICGGTELEITSVEPNFV